MFLSQARGKVWDPAFLEQLLCTRQCPCARDLRPLPSNPLGGVQGPPESTIIMQDVRLLRK